MIVRIIPMLIVLLAAWLGQAVAAPSRIIILRHGEKADDWKLCDIGQQRANALAANYLGRDAAQSLFAAGEEPAFFLAITLHTLELASPAVASWNKPIILYSVVPETGVDKDALTKQLNRRTQEAARNVLANPALQGKTVVMVWEHHHIADAKLDTKFADQAVTLRRLLRLDILPGVPATWPNDNYDYFWIVDFAANSNVPSKFTMVKQTFGGAFAAVPANDWSAPNGLQPSSGCELKDD